MSARDPAAIAAALPEVWQQMERTELEVPFATLYGAELAKIPLTDAAGALAFRIGLLSPDYERVARDRQPLGGIEPFLIGVARGNLDGINPPDPVADEARHRVPHRVRAPRHAEPSASRSGVPGR